MSPRAAMYMLGALALTMLALILTDPKVKLFGHAALLPKSSDVLADRAEEMLRRLGYAAAPGDRAYGFETDDVYEAELVAHHPTRSEWDEVMQRERPTLVDFWYRQTSAPDQLRPGNVKGRVTWMDPPPLHGSVQVRLDPSGRLHELLAVPAEEGVNPKV